MAKAINPLVLLGGGIDSTATLVKLLKHGYLCSGIHFTYGQRAFLYEFDACKYFCDKYSVPLKQVFVPINEIGYSKIMLPSIDEVDNKPNRNMLEGRNIIFMAMAATYAITIGCDSLALGYHREPAHSPFPDATMAAVDAFCKLQYVAYERKLDILTPYAGATRTELLEDAMKLDPEIITHTHTCYFDTKGGCGECIKCKQLEAMLSKKPLPENR